MPMLQLMVPADHGATDSVEVSADALAVRARRHPGDTYVPLWYYFGVHNAGSTPVNPVTVEVRDLPTGSDTYEPFWKHSVWSRDGRQWTRIPPAVRHFGPSTLTVRDELRAGGSLWLAVIFPLPLSHYDMLDHEMRRPGASGLRVEPLPYGHSVEGRPLRAYRVGLEAGHPKPSVLLMAGHHAVEQSGKIMVETILRDYHSGASAGESVGKLLETHDLFFIPLANPDGCYAGRMNSNASGVVMDRADDNSPETSAILRLLDEIKPRVLINCHGWGNEIGNPPYEELYRFADSDPLFQYLKQAIPGGSSSGVPHLFADQFAIESYARDNYGTECAITELNFHWYCPPDGGPPRQPTLPEIQTRARKYFDAIARYCGGHP